MDLILQDYSRLYLVFYRIFNKKLLQNCAWNVHRGRCQKRESREKNGKPRKGEQKRKLTGFGMRTNAETRSFSASDILLSLA